MKTTLGMLLERSERLRDRAFQRLEQYRVHLQTTAEGTVDQIHALAQVERLQRVCAEAKALRVLVLTEMADRAELAE